MQPQISQQHLWKFYTGTFISQLGNYVFIAGMIFFPKAIGWSHLQVGLLLGASHLFGMLSLLVFGDIGDRISPKKIIVTVELLAMCISICLMLLWGSDFPYSKYLFILFVGFKAVLTSIQSPARNKYIKILSKNHQHTKNLSIFLSSITSGTSLFSAFLCLLFFKNVDFTYTMAFDALSFLLGGILIFNLPDISFSQNTKKSITDRFKDYFSIDKTLIFKDLSLSILISGISILIVRISAIEPSLTFVLQALFGLSFFVSGYIFSKIKQENYDHFTWLFFSLSYGLLYFARQEWSVVLFTFLVFLSYAKIVQSYTVEWQQKTPVEITSSVFGIRSLLNILILGCGEIFAGKIASNISIYNESLIRSAICLFIALTIVSMRKRARPA